MIEIDLYSSDINFFKKISQVVSVKKIFTDRKLCEKFKTNIKKKKIEYKVIKKKKDLNRIKQKAKLGICYGFGIIFPKIFIDSYEMGIWNFHPGDLPYYRGRHPISWAILNGEKRIFLSVHQINHNIDQGYLLYKTSLLRKQLDGEEKILFKFRNIFSKSFVRAFKNYKNNKKVKLKYGKYYPAIKSINIQNSKKVTDKFIRNAIISQKNYNGILVNGKKYKNFEKKVNKKKNCDLIECKFKKKIFLY